MQKEYIMIQCIKYEMLCMLHYNVFLLARLDLFLCLR